MRFQGIFNAIIFFNGNQYKDEYPYRRIRIQNTVKKGRNLYMLAVERRKAMLDIIRQNGRALVTELGTAFQVTEETVRRDLEELERRGLIVRTHGGAVSYDESLPELSAEVRETLNPQGKRKIAKKAANYINQGDTIFLDASTTVSFLAKEIKNMSGLTVITNSLRVINELSKNDRIKLVCTGGTLVGDNNSFTGSTASGFVERNLFADKCFISVAGVTADGGMLESREDEAAIKRIMCKNSKSTILLCDKTKLGRVRLYIIAPIVKAGIIITDEEKDNQYAREISEKGVIMDYV